MAVENETMMGKRVLSVSSGMIQVETMLKQLEKMPRAITYKGFWKLLHNLKKSFDSTGKGKANDYRSIRKLEEDVYDLLNIIIRMQKQLSADLKEKEADHVAMKQRSDQVSTTSTGFSTSKLDDQILGCYKDKKASETFAGIDCRHRKTNDYCKEQDEGMEICLEQLNCKPETPSIDDMLIEITSESKYGTVEVAKNLVKRKWTIVRNRCKDFWNKFLCWS